MKMNYSINNLQRQNEISQLVKPDSELTFFAETLNLFLYGGFFIFLIHKHKAHLGPVHLFELVALMDLFIWLLCSISNKLTMLQEFRRDPLFCYGMKIVEHACFLLGHQHYQLPAGDVPINLLQCVLHQQYNKLEGNSY